VLGELSEPVETHRVGWVDKGKERGAGEVCAKNARGSTPSLEPSGQPEMSVSNGDCLHQTHLASPRDT